jgi:hypothetical protein
VERGIERVIEGINLIKIQYIYVWPLWAINRHIIKWRQECRSGPTQGWVPVGRGRVKGESERGWIWLICFVYLYENRTIKLSEIVLRRKKGFESDQGTL